jgi:DNA-binding LacI/PurR family transcriptional regulator
MKRAPTIHELAADLGVSSTTVWRAFQEKARIGAATRRRILARAKTLGYVPSQVAQNLSQGRTRTLGVIVPMVGHPVFSTLVEKIEEAAFRRGYNVILCDTYLSMERETDYCRMLLSRRVEGVVVVPFAERSRDGHRHLDELRKRGIPVVLLEQAPEGTPFPSVVADNFEASRAMTRHLIARGHRKIAFAFHPVHAWDPVGTERLAGFRRAMADARLTRGARLLLDACELKEGRVWTYRPDPIAACFGADDRPTALFAGMDLLAIGALDTLRGLGLQVPRDVAVAGFDDIEFSAFAQPPLTTVAQPTEAMAVRAAELLFAQIDGGIAKKSTAERFPCRLVIRASCGAPSLS